MSVLDSMGNYQDIKKLQKQILELEQRIQVLEARSHFHKASHQQTPVELPAEETAA